MDNFVLVAAAAGLFLALLVKWALGDGKVRPPGPWNIPIVGYLPFLSRLPHLDFQDLAKKYGNIYSLRLGSPNVIILNDFESTKDAFSQDAFIGRPKESPFSYTKETLETGAFTGLPWKEQRRFSMHLMRDLGLGKSRMEENLHEEITELLEQWEKDSSKPIIPADLLASSMSNNVASLVFGRRLKYDDPDRQMMDRNLNETSAANGQVNWLIFFPWVKTVFRILGIGDVDRVARITEEFRNYIRKEINEHEATLNPSHIRDYIDGYLIEIQRRKVDPAFCKGVLLDMVETFFVAGSETVRLSVDWLILTAAAYPEKQRRVQAEIDDVIGHERLPTAADVNSMPFTSAFIHEIMRWRTIIPLNITRYTIADTELHGYHIDKHSQVVANLWAIHHDKEYWGKDADEFQPERFLTEDGKEFKKRNHSIPFSIGKRACPGEALANAEVFLYFASILQKFTIQLPEGKSADLSGELGIGLMPKPQAVIMTKRS